MRAIEVERPGGEFVAVERAMPSPDDHDVLIRVEACGVCHGDAIVKEGEFPNLRYPRVPGHGACEQALTTGISSDAAFAKESRNALFQSLMCEMSLIRFGGQVNYAV